MKASDLVQSEQIKRMGEYLREQREQRSISLEEIAVKTYIPQRLLNALELGQADKLPQPIFVQGFVRRYADAIGLDGVALAKTFVVEPSIVPLAADPHVARPLPPLAPVTSTGASSSTASAASPAHPTAASGNASKLSPAAPNAAVPNAAVPNAASANWSSYKSVDPSLAAAAVVPAAPVPVVASVQPEAQPADATTVVSEFEGPADPAAMAPMSPVDAGVDAGVDPVSSPAGDDFSGLDASGAALVENGLGGHGQATVGAVPPAASESIAAVLPKPMLSAPQPQSRSAAAPQPLPELKTSGYGQRSSRSLGSYLPFILLAAGASVFLFAIVLTVFRPKEATVTGVAPTSASPAVSPNQTASQAQPTPQSSQPAGVAPSPSATVSPAPSASPEVSGPVQVTMSLTDEAWIEVMADGKVIFEGTQPKNFQKIWSAQKSLTVTSGNAGAVMLSQNQKPAKPMGALGEVKEANFPEDPAPATPIPTP